MISRQNATAHVGRGLMSSQIGHKWLHEEPRAPIRLLPARKKVGFVGLG